MDIKIERNINEELEALKIKVDLFKGFKASLTLFAIGLGIIFIYQKEIKIDYDVAAGYLLSAMVFFILSLIVFYIVYKRKKAFHEYSKVILKEYSNSEIYTTIKMDNSFFIYESKKKYNKLSWSSFSKYMFKNENIVILLDEGLSSSFVIKRNELSEDEFLELYNFVSKNFSIKK